MKARIKYAQEIAMRWLFRSSGESAATEGCVSNNFFSERTALLVAECN